jgi:glycerol-3-phosphate dehydrogenase (NAD(P)+)
MEHHGAQQRALDLDAFREHTLARGVNPVLYWTLRAILVPFFLVYFRLDRIGREHLPRRGPLLLAANHRSFLDPFVIGTLVRRPVYYMAKRELFEHRLLAWLLNGLGAFPVDRGVGDAGAMDTARAILARGDCVVIFPEGTRVRPGPLGDPRRGVGRLALETGVPVAPVAAIGTEDVRRGWRIRPRKVRLRVGRPLLFPTVELCPSPTLAASVTARIWACVCLQWEWLGGVGATREDGDRPRRTSARRGRAPQNPSSTREEARAA